MTATFDATTDTRMETAARLGAGPRNLGHLAVRSVGVVLVLAGIGVWLEPTAYPGPDLVAMKLGLSLFLSLAGFLILQDRTDTHGPEMQIDMIRREVRVFSTDGAGRRASRRIPLQDLGQADMKDDAVRLSTAGGEMLGDVSLQDPRVRARLCGALQDAGKL